MARLARSAAAPMARSARRLRRLDARQIEGHVGPERRRRLSETDARTLEWLGSGRAAATACRSARTASSRDDGVSRAGWPRTSASSSPPPPAAPARACYGMMEDYRSQTGWPDASRHWLTLDHTEEWAVDRAFGARRCTRSCSLPFVGASTSRLRPSALSGWPRQRSPVSRPGPFRVSFTRRARLRSTSGRHGRALWRSCAGRPPEPYDIVPYGHRGYVMQAEKAIIVGGTPTAR